MLKKVMKNDKREIEFLKLVADMIHGRVSMDSVVFGDVFGIAKKQGLRRIMLPILKKYGDSGKLIDEKNELEGELTKLSSEIIAYTKKQFAVNCIVRMLEENGIECVMLKGDTLAELYPESDVRMSGDTDLLIDPKKEKKCLKFFKKSGSYVKKRTATNNQSVIIHPKGGKFEIHISLDTKQVTESWYGNIKLVSEPWRTVRVNEIYKYKTLGYTDTAVNLILHFIRHFVGGIASMRMMLDVLLFLDKNKENIDFNRVNGILQKLKYDKIYESLKYIGAVYFELENIVYSEKYEKFANKILEDVFECGDYGFDKMEEQNYTYSVYSAKRFSRFSKGNYKLYKIKLLVFDTYDLIFKDKYEMTKFYPTLQKCGFLLPFMYVYRAFSCVFNTLTRRKSKKENAKSENNEILKKRLELIDELDMI